jgi:hypothetical protein
MVGAMLVADEQGLFMKTADALQYILEAERETNEVRRKYIETMQENIDLLREKRDALLRERQNGNQDS